VDGTRSWDWIAVTQWCYIFSVVVIISKVTPPLLNVLLSWMSALMDNCSFVVILIFTFSVGMVLFMLPPIPGPPIYLFGGFVISDKCPWGFWWGSFICIALCFFLKLSACALQQVGFGGMLGHSHWVRQTVGVHKPFIRAIESVLRRPGMSFGKVVILCGGPDWPTSVLAGMLKLSVWQCLLGTCPIIVNLVPLTLTGSFYLKRDNSEVWARAGNLMFTLTILTSVVFWAGMAWAIQNEFAKHHEALTKPKEEFIELDWLDFRSDFTTKRCALTWAVLPRSVKAIFVVGAAGLVLVSQVFFWRFKLCFGQFGVTDDIATLIWYGEDGLVRLPAVICLAFASFCWCGKWYFNWWSARHRKAPAEAAARELETMEADWKRNRLIQASSAKAGPAPAAALEAKEKEWLHVSQSPPTQLQPPSAHVQPGQGYVDYMQGQLTSISV